MTIPEMVEVKDGGTTKMVPWPSAMFDHAPIVAAAAMLTAVKVDILNAESLAAEFMLSKVDAPTFNFNKIEPLAFARTGYINPGDSLDLKVMIAAYDSTDIPPIRYGINDSIPENWKETSGSIPLKGESSGQFSVKGSIGVKEKGQLTWKPWEFNYTVGAPSGAVSLPEMNVLYRGYDNKVVGAVSGYVDYKLSGSNVSLSKSGDKWIAKPGNGREAKINLTGIAEDGSSANVGTFDFRVRDLPKPTIKLGSVWDGEKVNAATIKAMNRLFAQYPPEIPLEAQFSITSYEIVVSGAPRSAKGTGASLNGDAMGLLKQVRGGATITIMTDFRGPDGRTKRKNAVIQVK
jgi:gliding motility-associated protein GldM